LARGDLGAAMRWVMGLSEPTHASRPAPAVLMLAYECEHQRIAPAQVWLAHGRANAEPTAIARAIDLLAIERASAGSLGLGWLRLKVTVLQALAHDALGRRDQALDLLQDALRLAEPEGWVRVLADEGPPIASLLREVRGVSTPFLDGVMAATRGSTSP